MAYSFCIFAVVVFLAVAFSNEVVSSSGLAAGDFNSKPKNYSKINCGDFSTDEKLLEPCLQEIRKQNWTKSESSLHPRFCLKNDEIRYGDIVFDLKTVKSLGIVWTNDKKDAKLAIQITSIANRSNEIYTYNSSANWKKYYHQLIDVKAGAEYRTSILRQNPAGEVFQDDVVEFNYTVPATLVAPNVSWYNFTDFFPNGESSTNVTFKWNSSDIGAVLPCQFTFIFVADQSDDLVQQTCEFPALQECLLSNLRYSTTYIVMVKAYGEVVIDNARYRVPSCRQIAKMKNTTCSKLSKVEKVFVNEDATSLSNSSITVSWAYDDIEPNHFNVTIMRRNSSGYDVYYDSKITSGNNATFKLPYGEYYEANVTAYKDNISSETVSYGGFRTSPALETSGLVYSNPNDSLRSPLFSIVTILVVCALLLLLAISLVVHYKRKAGDPDKLKKLYDKIQITNTEPISLNNGIIKTAKEMQKLKLVGGRLLGKGNFGVVHLGTLMCNGKKLMDVAIKTLRDNATPKDIEQFEKEIELMRNVGFHQNIVSMVGSYPDARRPLLIVEYCPFGDLHAYLCNIKKSQECFVACNPTSEVQYKNQVPLENENTSKRFVENRIYGVPEDIAVPRLTICDLLSFGRQVATGMDYLASNRVIHRDLAARNVLLCDDKTVKISDFGLSRDIYAENIYRKVRGEAMPIKWMAPESLSKGEYSAASDVWSFGVFLWELLTLGDDPYPDVVITLPEVLFLQLKAGYRMSNPCPSYPQLYEIMSICWQEERELRPEFSTLRDLLDENLRKCSPNEYVIVTGNED